MVSRTKHLERAIALIGSQTALAAVVGHTQQAVSLVLCDRRKVPAEWVLPIERATSGEVKRHELRPDLYPADEAA